MKVSRLCFAAALIFLLSACGMAEGEQPRPAQKELTLHVEGGEETLPATLWQEEQYSMYLPEEGWEQDARGVWRPRENEKVGLSVAYYPGEHAATVEERFVEEFSSFGFLPLEDGVLEGYDGVAGMTLCIRLLDGEDGCYAVCSQYPTETAEGFGARLQQLAQTFELV